MECNHIATHIWTYAAGNSEIYSSYSGAALVLVVMGCIGNSDSYSYLFIVISGVSYYVIFVT